MPQPRTTASIAPAGRPPARDAISQAAFARSPEREFAAVGRFGGVRPIAVRSLTASAAFEPMTR
ncbi:MAG TPA: hypothetical protein VFA66_07265 [Gaiellaceae bacterium]|nr:hypothetical protein [Gaiellaceae bacterium]